MAALGQDLLPISGPAAIKAYVGLRAALGRAADDAVKMETRLGELLREMRRELGHPATHEESRPAGLALLAAEHGTERADLEPQSGLR